jgi:hypothetical protein
MCTKSEDRKAQESAQGWFRGVGGLAALVLALLLAFSTVLLILGLAPTTTIGLAAALCTLTIELLRRTGVVGRRQTHDGSEKSEPQLDQPVGPATAGDDPL